MVPARASDEESPGFVEKQLALMEEAERHWLGGLGDDEVPPALYALIQARRELERRVAAAHRSRPPSADPAGLVCEWAAIALFVASIAWGLMMLSKADEADAAAAALAQ